MRQTPHEGHVTFGATVYPKGILRQPTKEFPFEDKNYLRPHITKRPRSLHVDNGALPGADIPASDVVKVHAYRRRRVPVRQDRDSPLTYDKAPIRDGDVLMGRALAPDTNMRPRGNENGVNRNATAAGAQW